MDTAAALAGTTGDYAPFQLTAIGALRVELVDEVGAELDFRTEGENWNAADHGILIFGRDQDSTPDKYRAVNLDANGNVKVLSSTGAGLALETGGNLASAVTSLQIMDDWDNAASGGASVSGDVAHDTADAGEPEKQGFKATTSLAGLTLVVNADRTDGFAGIDGVQITRPHCNLEDIVTGNASNTDGASTACIAAGAAGIKHYLTSVILTNTSASNIYVEIKDGTTVKLTIPVPANGGAIFNPPVPIPGTAATAWNFDASAATTTVYCSMVAFKSKV